MGAKIHLLSFHIHTIWAKIFYMVVENLTKVFNITKFLSEQILKHIRCFVLKVLSRQKMWIATLFVQQKLFSSRFCLLHLKIKKIESGFISELLCPLRKRPLSKNCFEEARGKFVFPYEKLCSVKRISLCVCKTSF